MTVQASTAGRVRILTLAVASSLLAVVRVLA